MLKQDLNIKPAKVTNDNKWYIQLIEYLFIYYLVCQFDGRLIKDLKR